MITLSTLHLASAQEVFDQAATHLLRQGVQSINSKTCMYRSPEGLKCAAGCFISDEEYLTSYEGRSWNLLLDLPGHHRELIRKLQELHDYRHPNKWGKALRALARDEGLSAHVVEEFS